MLVDLFSFSVPCWLLYARFPHHVGCFPLSFHVMSVAFCSFSASCWLLSAHFLRHVGCFLLIFHVMLVDFFSFSASCWLLYARFPRHVGCFLLSFHVMLVAFRFPSTSCLLLSACFPSETSLNFCDTAQRHVIRHVFSIINIFKTIILNFLHVSSSLKPQGFGNDHFFRFLVNRVRRKTCSVELFSKTNLIAWDYPRFQNN
jgi:hypothetical protein